MLLPLHCWVASYRSHAHKLYLLYHERVTFLFYFAGFSFSDLRWNTHSCEQSQGVSLFDLFCDSDHRYGRGRLYFVTYLFYLSKYYETIDTVFIVLKKVRAMKRLICGRTQ